VPEPAVSRHTLQPTHSRTSSATVSLWVQFPARIEVIQAGSQYITDIPPASVGCIERWHFRGKHNASRWLVQAAFGTKAKALGLLGDPLGKLPATLKNFFAPLNERDQWIDPKVVLPFGPGFGILLWHGEAVLSRTRMPWSGSEPNMVSLRVATAGSLKGKPNIPVAGTRGSGLQLVP
jgi:hypothetical protein